jgi:hypothetical protein
VALFIFGCSFLGLYILMGLKGDGGTLIHHTLTPYTHTLHSHSTLTLHCTS